MTVSTISKFHMFDLARQLLRLDVLDQLFTGRPLWKMRREHIPREKVTSFPPFQVIFEGMGRIGMQEYPFKEHLRELCHTTFDQYAARNLEQTDVFHALVYGALKSGKIAQRRGSVWVCDCPTPHTVVQERLVAEESGRVGIAYKPKEERLIEYEVQSYGQSDALAVPSGFARDSFISEGIISEKITVLPYGANLDQFRPIPGPWDRTRGQRLNILFVGILDARKAIHDLARAVSLCGIPSATVTFVGARQRDTDRLLAAAPKDRLRVLPPQSKADLARLYSEADVLVLPSIAEGLALVLGEALACGCPVIASDNTGAVDFITNGVEGFLVPIRSPEKIAERLVWMSEHPTEARAMRQAALRRVQEIGGWDEYGNSVVDTYARLLATRN